MDDHDVQEVLRIRLSDRVQEDYLAWHYESSGIFSVRSAYWVAQRLQAAPESRGQEGSSRVSDGSRSLWRLIWSAQVPPKVRVFAWRLR